MKPNRAISKVALYSIVGLLFLFSVLPIIASADDTRPIKKWNPGHYIYQNQGAVLDEKDLDAPNFSGVHIRVPWRMIEPQKGIYNIELISSILQKAKSKGKVVSIAFEDKTWGSPTEVEATKCVPEYLLSEPEAQGAVYTEKKVDGAFRCVAKRWVPKVEERWFALLSVIGKTFDLDPTLVMVQDTESAGQQFASSDDVRIAYCSHMKNRAKAFAASFPHTPWAMSLNWSIQKPETCRDELVQLISDLGGGITHPDSPPPNGQGDQFDKYFELFKGKIVSAPIQEASNISGKNHISEYTCEGRPCVWADMLTLMQKWGAHYVYWPKSGWGDKKPVFSLYKDMVPLLEARGFPVVKECPDNIRCGLTSEIDELKKLIAEHEATILKLNGHIDTLTGTVADQNEQRKDALEKIQDVVNILNSTGE